MKKTLLCSLLLLLTSSLFAQKKTFPNAEKNAPSFEPIPNLDLTPPVVTCRNGLTTNMMPSGAIQQPASDFLLSVSDNVTPTNEIKIAIRRAGTGFGFPMDAQGNPLENITFDCNELGTNAVELWAKDLKGNTAHCQTSLIVQDNFGTCLGNSPWDWMIEMSAKTEMSDGVEEMEYIATGTNPNGPFYVFNVDGPDGCCHLDVPLGSDVTASPVKDDNPLNGVTVNDLVLINKHILGVEKLNSPYKMIAADADRNGVIDSNDIIELRKLIVGIYTELPNNNSWRFVDKSYVFPDPSNPFATVFPESIIVQNIQSPVSAEFVGIKVGDVNNTAVANASLLTEKSLNNAEKNIPSFEPAPHLDLTPPVIICLNGLNVNIMPTGEIHLWTSDFLHSVSDNVTPTDQIKIAIRKAGTGFGFPEDFAGNPILRVVFDCDEVGTHTVEIWAKDLAGNTTYCLTDVLIHDNLGNCWPLGDWLIEACVHTETLNGLEETDFEIMGTHPNEPFYGNEVPGGKAQCMYYDVPVGSDVTVGPIKDDNPLNGVTTYDIVLISKHYRGIELLNSPYKIIAADANRDGLVTVEDSIELKKLILGIYDELPNNTSWRFVDKNYVFPDPSNPFLEAFPETVTFQNIQIPGSAEFIAIKIGDVNGTSVANLASPQERTVHQENPGIGLPRPNPTQGDAILPIYLPNAENLRIELSDLNGKLLWVNDLQLEEGNHHVEIPASSMSGKGVYVWRIWAGEVVKAGKLVRL